MEIFVEQEPTMKRRILNALLCAAILLSLVPLSVFAASGTMTVKVTNCYYLIGTATVGYNNDTSVSGTITIDNVTALTDTQMRLQANFIGFDFIGVWTMYGDPDYPYPQLRMSGELTLGDVDGDDKIGAVDYAMVKRSVLGTYKLSNSQIKTADVNNDGSIDAIDYAMIKRHVLGTYTIK